MRAQARLSEGPRLSEVVPRPRARGSVGSAGDASAAKEAASAEAVNARQGITGRLDSGVINGIIGVQVLLKRSWISRKEVPPQVEGLSLCSG